MIEHEGVSRRDVLLGLGAAAGAVAAIAAVPTTAQAAVAPAGVPAVPEALAAPLNGLTYIGIDAEQFFASGATGRLYENLTGTKLASSGTLFAGLPLPAGSTIHQINAGYQGQPIVSINRRAITQPNPATAPQQMFLESMDASPGGPFSSTKNLSTPILLDRESTYTIGFFVSPGSAIFGCSIGYVPPTQSFVPFAGQTPRVLDTREPGPLTGRLNPDEERIVDLGFAGSRSAVLNLTVAGTGGPGFVAVFAGGVAYPGNSSINFTGANQVVANGVISATNTAGQITIRGGGSPTHVIIDRIGFMV